MSGINIDKDYMGYVMAQFQGMLDSEEGSFDLMLDYLRLIVKHDIWKEYPMYNHPRKVFSFKTFNEFIETPRSKGGLGTDKGKLLKICEDDQWLAGEIDRLTIKKPNDNGVNNDTSFKGNRYKKVKQTSGFGNTKATQKTGNQNNDYIKGRLKKYHPELFEKVMNHELSPNAAAIKAGFRKKTMTITADLDGILKASKKLDLEFEVYEYLKENIFALD